MSILLSTAYMGNIQYFSKLATGRAIIEVHENFQKQTYRNHCRIMTAGGVRALTVPVVWNHYAKTPIGEVAIDYSTPWQRTHWRTLTAAYASSPYFEHYAPRIEDMICGVRYEKLLELNTALTRGLLDILKIAVSLEITTEYRLDIDHPNDFRESISHKPRLARSDGTFHAPEYYQVFGESVSFEPNLSVLDLIFCEGPLAAAMISESIV